jgi:hypothetical protein
VTTTSGEVSGLVRRAKRFLRVSRSSLPDLDEGVRISPARTARRQRRPMPGEPPRPPRIFPPDDGDDDCDVE